MLERYRLDAPVLIGWSDGQHLLDFVEERDGRVVLGGDPWAPITG